jgi:predicted RNase H-like HicB family nuclease
MRLATYPAFFYKTQDGFKVTFPDLPNCQAAVGRSAKEVEAAAKSNLKSELERLRWSCRAPSPPTNLSLLVSVKGGSTRLIHRT